MFESQFFGYRKGAFTGAIHDEPGYFDPAHGGILFLDEILGWFMEYDRPGNVRELTNEVRRYTIMDEVELRSPGLKKPGRGGFHQADLLLSIHLALWVGKKGMFTISSVIKGSYRY